MMNDFMDLDPMSWDGISNEGVLEAALAVCAVVLARYPSFRSHPNEVHSSWPHTKAQLNYIFRS